MDRKVYAPIARINTSIYLPNAAADPIFGRNEWNY
jgi:hypothetical protein